MNDFSGVTGDDWKRLLDAALEVRTRAYAPYSKFYVGAAILLGDGSIVVGVNVENATYGATVCAERSAVQTAVTQGHQDFRAICVVTQADHPVAPCGVCRQVLAEFVPELPVMMANTEGATLFLGLGELLPHQFGQDDFVDA